MERLKKISKREGRSVTCLIELYALNNNIMYVLCSVYYSTYTESSLVTQFFVKL